MGLLIPIWSSIAAACGMLGLIQLFLWVHNPPEQTYPLSAVMAFSATVVALLEMAQFTTPDPERYQALLLWQNLAISMVLVAMVWFVHAYLPTARRWVAVTITALWSVGVLVNFLLPGNLTFSVMDELDVRTTFWGEAFHIPEGERNPYKWLVDFTVLLIPLYVIDASVRAWEKGMRERTGVITGGVVVFVVFAGVHAIMVDAGVVETPYMISVGFLAIVAAQTWVVARDAVKVQSLTREVHTTRQEAERLMRANLLGEIASALAHELNQPLAAILGNAQAAQKFLGETEPDMQEIREIVDDIVRDDKRAGEVVHGLHAMLRSGEVEAEIFDLSAATRDIVELVRGELDSQGVRVRIETAPDVSPIRGGRVAIQQVVLNLVLNAARAMADAGSEKRVVTINLRRDGGRIRMDVEDSGPGIAPDVLPKIFDAFFTTRDKGLGMGLAISRRIVEAHGGEITADSADTAGAHFTIRLPTEI